MSTSTLTPGGKHDNPGEKDYEDKFNDIARADNDATFNDIVNNPNTAKDAPETPEEYAKNKELGAATGAPKNNESRIINNVTPKADKKKRKLLLKRGGPILGAGALFGIGGFLLVGLASPSLLIVQFKETMMEKFNTQLASMETRSSKLLVSKLNGSTSGCDGLVKLRCKFTTMSSKQVEKLKAAGIEVQGKEVIGGRVKPTALVLLSDPDNPINPRDFTRRANADPEFRSALREAYNPKFAGTVGKAWAAVATMFKTSKKPPELGAADDKEKAQEKMNQIAKEGTEDGRVRTTLAADGEECTGSTCISQEDADAANGKANEVADSASGSGTDEIRARLNGISTGSITSFFKITGWADSACQVYGAATTLTYAAKALRAAQMVRYAMIFFSIADAIKAGASPDPADTGFLADIITKTTVDPTDPTKTLMGSATDSFGYKYAAYGDTSASSQSMMLANRFTAGGGFVGELSTGMNTVLATLGGRQAAKNTCGFLANPVVQGASLVLGIAVLLVPGANVGKTVAQAGISGAVAIAIASLPALLLDIVAGSTTDNIYGEETGNAVPSGAGKLLSDSLAAQNGNGLMSKDDAANYLALQTETSNQYIADELRNTSPFDATNPHTFVGSIASSLIPLRSSSNPITTLGSLFATSISSLKPASTSALTQEELARSMEVCEDPDAEEVGYAVDPFCNVIRGISPQYLDKDPVAVIDSLIANGDLNPSTEQPTTQYSDFISKCITNTEPVGYSDPSTGFDPAEAEMCKITSSKVADRYIFHMDQRIELGMNGEDVADSVPTATSGDTSDKSELAKRILTKGNVTFGGGVRPDIQAVADGTADTNSMPCGVNIGILRLIDIISDQYSITVSSLNRLCTNSSTQGGKSRHFAGNGSAFDISVINGKATSGRDANAIGVINLIMPKLSEYGAAGKIASGIGQSQCGATPTLAAHVQTFADGCNHLHIDIPPQADPNLKYDPSGW